MRSRRQSGLTWKQAERQAGRSAFPWESLAGVKGLCLEELRAAHSRGVSRTIGRDTSDRKVALCRIAVNEQLSSIRDALTRLCRRECRGTRVREVARSHIRSLACLFVSSRPWLIVLLYCKMLYCTVLCSMRLNGFLCDCCILWCWKSSSKFITLNKKSIRNVIFLFL